MLKNALNWIVDTKANNEILDLYFVTTDLVDILITEAERTETALYDAMATKAAEQVAGRSNIPIGKQVF